MGRHGVARSGSLAYVRLSFAVLTLWTGTIEAATTVELISRDSAGAIANAGSTVSAVSADGRFVAFASGASNLVPGDTNAVFDVFVHDRATGVTERVSVDSNGAEGNGVSQAPAISGDGGVVAFVSRAANLVPDDTNGRFDVFVHDRQSGVTERVSVGSSGAQATVDSLSPWISADGRRVVFASSASLVPGDTNASFDVFVHDRDAAVTVRASVDSSGAQANGASLAPRLSADGLVVVFHSSASNLVPGDTNGVLDVFVHDLASGATERASVAADGSQGSFQSVAGSLSADGRFVAFNSDSTNLVAGDGNFRTDVFLRDRASATLERVSVDSSGGEGDGQSGFVDPPAVSADGRFVAFTSGATNLVPDDSNSVVDVFVRDRAAGVTERVSVAADGTEATGPSTLWPGLSADASVVVFASSAANLVAGDTNNAQDVFAFVRADDCGNGELDAGEECDDGNVEDGDCCSSTCTAEPPETVCEDGDPCTSGDSCAGGACVAGPLDPEACLDPMDCWAALPVGPPLKPGKVSIADAFHGGTVDVRGPQAVCASVDLLGRSEPSPSVPRLACHDARAEWKKPPAFPTRKLTVTNRFGVQKFKVFEPSALCLAAGREAPPEPGVLDSFACYRADRVHERSKHGGWPKFGSWSLEPIELCLAADVGGSEASHPDVHLACYPASGRRHFLFDFFRRRKETLSHVFGTETLALLGESRTCVPSTAVETPATP